MTHKLYRALTRIQFSKRDIFLQNSEHPIPTKSKLTYHARMQQLARKSRWSPQMPSNFARKFYPLHFPKKAMEKNIAI